MHIPFLCAIIVSTCAHLFYNTQQHHHFMVRSSFDHNFQRFSRLSDSMSVGANSSTDDLPVTDVNGTIHNAVATTAATGNSFTAASSSSSASVHPPSSTSMNSRATVRTTAAKGRSHNYNVDRGVDVSSAFGCSATTTASKASSSHKGDTKANSNGKRQVSVKSSSSSSDAISR
jgi:hypothetical protein